MPEEKKRSGVKVCGWLSDEVFSKLTEKGYKSHTVIVRRGAELIIGQPIGEHGELEQGVAFDQELGIIHKLDYTIVNEDGNQKRNLCFC